MSSSRRRTSLLSKLFPSRKSRRQTTEKPRQKQPLWPTLFLEPLEDRIAPAVTPVGAANWFGQFESAFNSAISGAQDLDAALEIFGPSFKLEDTFNFAQDLQDAIDDAQNDAGNFGSTQLVAYLNNLDEATGDIFTASSITPFSNTTNSGVAFTLQVDLGKLVENISPDLSFSLLALDLGGLQIDLQNDLTANIRAYIEDSDNDDTADVFGFVPNGTSVTYSPSVSGDFPLIDGTLGEVIDYSGDLSFDFSPTFDFAFGSSTTPQPLTQLASSVQSPNISDAIFDVTLEAQLVTDPLPDFKIVQTFQFDVESGEWVNDDIDPQFFIGNVEIDPDNPEGSAALVVVDILEGAGADILGTIGDIIHPDVAEILLGETKIYQDYEVVDLLGGNTPIDVLGAVFGVPTSVTNVIESLIRAGALADKAASGDTNQIQEALQESDGSGIQFLGSDPDELFDSVLKIFRGETVDLVKWEADILDDPDLQLFVNNFTNTDELKIFFDEDAPNSMGGMTDYLVTEVHLDSNTIKQKILSGISDTTIRQTADILLTYLGTGGIDFSLDFGTRIAAAVSLGVDTSFLNSTGPIESRIANSFYISSGNLIDFGVNIDLKVHASFADGGPLGFIQQVGDDFSEAYDNTGLPKSDKEAYETVTTLGGALSLTGGLPSPSELLDKAGNATFEIGASGSFLFGICDPTPDGRLRLPEIDFGDITSHMALRSNLQIDISLFGDILGIHYDVPIPKIHFGFAAGCRPSPDGPALENFDDQDGGAGGSTTPKPVFAEINDNADVVADVGGPILAVYGSSDSDVITISRNFLGFIEVTRGEDSLFFSPIDFQFIIVDLDGQHIEVDDDNTTPALPPEDGGDDTVHIFSSVPDDKVVVVWGGSGDDEMAGAGFNEFGSPDAFFEGLLEFHGGLGDDTLVGGAGPYSILRGEADNDILVAGPGQVLMTGDEGSDALRGMPEAFGFTSFDAAGGFMIGGDDNDFISVGLVSRGDFQLIGGSLVAESEIGTAPAPGASIILGGYGDDDLIAGNAIFDDSLIPGYNTISDPDRREDVALVFLAVGLLELTPDCTDGDSSILLGGPGSDTLHGTAEADLLVGGFINTAIDDGVVNELHGCDGDDVIVTGNALVNLATGDISGDQVTDGAGSAFGGNGNDQLFGVRGDDYLQGDANDDTIDAGLGTNLALGNGGEDTFFTGRGIDSLFGNGGDDTFFVINPNGTIHAPGGVIEIDGGGQSGDTLDMQNGGGASFDITYTAGVNGHDGTILTENGVSQQIDFVQLAKIFNTVTASSMIVNAPNLENDILVEAGDERDGVQLAKVSSNTFVPIQFANQAGLDVSGNAQDDTITLDLSIQTDGLQTINLFGHELEDIFNIKVTPTGIVTVAQGNDGDDIFNVGNDDDSLDDLLGQLTIEGNDPSASDEAFINDQGDTTANTYTITDTTVDRNGIPAITYKTIEFLQVNAGTNDDEINVDSTHDNALTEVNANDGADLFTIQGDGLGGDNRFHGNGADDLFTLNAGDGVTGDSLLVTGGDHVLGDHMTVNGTPGNDVMTTNLTDAAGGGNIQGLGTQIDFLTLEDADIDGQDGSNSLHFVDRTDGRYGSIRHEQAGIMFRPTSDRSGDITVQSGLVTPLVSFFNIDNQFSINGDGDGSGDDDVLTVLATSTFGLSSGAPFNELLSADGSDTIHVSDTQVTIDNEALGNLRSVQLAKTAGDFTFSALVVRAGNEEPIIGDHVTATPSANLNIFLDGMEPDCGTPGDILDVQTVGARTIFRSEETPTVPQHVRIGQVSDGASVGFINFETVANVGISTMGAGAGSPPIVRVRDVTTGQLRFDFMAYDPSFTGGVYTAAEDVNGDAIPDIVTGTGSGGGPHVKVFDGITGEAIFSFMAFHPSFTGGVSVAVGDVDCDGHGDIIVAAGPGGGPHVQIFSGKDLTLLRSFMVFDPNFTGGISVAAGDINADGVTEIIVGAGPGGGPHVKVFDGVDQSLLASFMAYDPSFTGGVFVAAGDINGDYIADIITGAGNGGGPHVKAFHGPTFDVMASFFVHNPSAPQSLGGIPLETGVRVGVADVDGDGILDIIVGKGHGTRPVLFGYNHLGTTELENFFAFDPEFSHGLFVGGSL